MKRFLLFAVITILGVVDIMAYTGYVGETIYLNPPSVNGTLGGAAWTSSNSKYVSVSGGTSGANVTINQYFTGDVKIDCQYAYTYYVGSKKEYGNGHAYYYISCRKSTAKISKTSLSLKVGQEAELSYSNSSGYELPFSSWKTDDKSIVNFYGKDTAYGKTVTITAKKAGKCKITFDGQCGSEPAVCNVTVTSVETKGMVLSPNPVTVSIGGTATIKPTFTPSDASPTLTWKSSNTSIATVSSAGIVKGITEGKVTITASTENGISATTNVEVLGRPKSITLPAQMTIYMGEPTSINVTFSPTNTYSTLTWHCSPSSAATISNNTIKGLAEGVATIYCTSVNGIQSNSCKVTIKGPRPTGISLSSESLTVPIGKKESLTYSLLPSNASASVTWKSSNTAVATVTTNGVITGIKQGQSIITLTTDNGHSATCKVTVPPNPQSIQFKETELELLEGSTSTLKATVSPSDAHYELTWSTSNEFVAIVTNTGKVFAQNPGTCTIKAITSNGKEAVCKVKVLKEDTYLTVWQSNGEQARFHFKTSPRIKYLNNEFHVISDELDIAFPERKVLKFTIDNFIDNQGTDIKPIFKNENYQTISLSNIPLGEHIEIFNMQGQCLESLTMGNNGDLRYSLDKFPIGIYIIKVGSTTIKIIKK